MDYDKLNKVVTQIAADTQMYFHCLSKLKCSLVPVLQLLIWQMPFSPSLSIRPTINILLSANKAAINFHCLTIGVYQFSSPML